MTDRRPRGTGSIEPTRDGRFRPRLPGNGGRLRPYATREEAAAALDGAIRELAEGSAIAPEGVTLATLGAELLEQRAARGMGSAQADQSRWSTHVAKAYFYTWPVKSIATRDVRTFVSTLLKKEAAPGYRQRKRRRPLSRSTIQSTLNLLRTVLEHAVELELLAVNPAAGVSIPEGAADTHEPWTYLLPDEQTKLLTCETIPEKRRLLMAFAIGSGMREGEVWNLEVRDVDLVAKRITVRFGGNKRATKGKRIRRIPLFGIALAAVTRQLELVEKQMNPCKLVWPQDDGSRRQKGEPSWWRSALAEAGLVDEHLEELPRKGTRGPRPVRKTYAAPNRHDERVPRWHDLRHTCGSSLVAGWWGRRWSTEEVKELLGHRSITTTERYAHLAESALAVAGAETPSPHDLPTGVAGTIENYWSHLRGLNSRPTVYESKANAEKVRALSSVFGEIVGLSERAVEALAAIAEGRVDGWRLVTEVLVELAKLGRIGMVDSRAS